MFAFWKLKTKLKNSYASLGDTDVSLMILQKLRKRQSNVWREHAKVEHISEFPHCFELPQNLSMNDITYNNQTK